MRSQASLVLLAALLLLLPAATAQSGQSGEFRDARDDADPLHDLRLLHWDVGNESAEVVVSLGAVHDSEAAYTAVLFLGTQGGAEPREWYIVHKGPGGATVLAGHADAPEPGVVVQDQNGTLVFTFDRVEPTGSPCAFVVAQSSINRGEGREVLDSAPSRNTDMQAAWDLGDYCDGMPQEAVPTASTQGPEDDNRIPAPVPTLLLAVLALVAAVRRRP